MVKRLEMPPRKQSRRVAAWIYTVINPIIESLQRELAFLEIGNLTWRPRTGCCEIIRTIKEYVDVNQWPNYADFLAQRSASVFALKFQRHDSDLRKLNGVAQELFNRMISWEEFKAAIESDLVAYGRASLQPQSSTYIPDREEIPKMAAEYVINNVQTLPSHYLDSAFWNYAGRNLLAFRSRPEFQELHRSMTGLGDVSAGLKRELEGHRLSLSSKYDVPAAPVPGISFEG
jgi:hypothetical protein